MLKKNDNGTMGKWILWQIFLRLIKHCKYLVSLLMAFAVDLRLPLENLIVKLVEETSLHNKFWIIVYQIDNFQANLENFF